MGIPDHLTCLLRNLYAGQEATVKTRHGTTDWFKIRKAVCQGCILSPCLFNFYAKHTMQNSGQDESQAGIKITGRTINNLRYADDTTQQAGSEEELNSFLMTWKRRVKKLAWNSTLKKLRSWHLVPSLHDKYMGKNGHSDRLFSWTPKSLQMMTTAIKSEDNCFLSGKRWQLWTVCWKAETLLCRQRSV